MNNITTDCGLGVRALLDQRLRAYASDLQAQELDPLREAHARQQKSQRKELLDARAVVMDQQVFADLEACFTLMREEGTVWLTRWSLPESRREPVRDLNALLKASGFTSPTVGSVAQMCNDRLYFNAGGYGPNGKRDAVFSLRADEPSPTAHLQLRETLGLWVMSLEGTAFYVMLRAYDDIVLARGRGDVEEHWELAKLPSNPQQLCYDEGRGWVYWVVQEALWRVPAGGGDAQLVSEAVRGVTVRESDGWLYVTRPDNHLALLDPFNGRTVELPVPRYAHLFVDEETGQRSFAHVDGPPPGRVRPLVYSEPTRTLYLATDQYLYAAWEEAGWTCHPVLVYPSYGMFNGGALHLRSVHDARAKAQANRQLLQAQHRYDQAMAEANAEGARIRGAANGELELATMQADALRAQANQDAGERIAQARAELAAQQQVAAAERRRGEQEAAQIHQEGEAQRAAGEAEAAQTEAARRDAVRAQITALDQRTGQLVTRLATDEVDKAFSGMPVRLDDKTRREFIRDLEDDYRPKVQAAVQPQRDALFAQLPATSGGHRKPLFDPHRWKNRVGGWV